MIFAWLKRFQKQYPSAAAGYFKASIQYIQEAVKQYPAGSAGYFKDCPNTKEKLREVVKTALQAHPKDCTFLEDTVDRVVAQVEERYPAGPDHSPAYIDAISQAFNECEIYCPHEGIDRRHEFGIQH